MKGLILKIFCNLSCKQYIDIRAFFIKNSEIFGLEKHFLPSYKQVVKEQKRAGPSNTPYILWKDDVILLEHEACEEQPLNILDTFGKRNPAMGTPNLCGYYYRMTDLVASQLFHLSDIVKANSTIRGCNLEETFTVTLKLSEDGLGSVQGVPSPRTKTKFKKKIFRTNLVILNVKCSEGKLVFKCAAPNSPDHPTVLNALTDENDTGVCLCVPRC